MIFFPYMVGLFIGIQIGKGIERSNNSYYHHTEKITTLEKQIKEYERQLWSMKNTFFIFNEKLI